MKTMKKNTAGRPQENIRGKGARTISVTLNDKLLKKIEDFQKKQGFPSLAWSARMLIERAKL